MRRFARWGMALFAAIAFASLLPSYENGIASRSLYGCSSCHGSAPNQNGKVTVNLVAANVLKKDAAIPVSVSVSGGPSGTTGGFCVDTTAGSFIAGSNNRVSGQSVIHANNKSRSWSFQYKGTTTGIVKWNAVAMASNGGGSGGDSWGFWGPDSSTPAYEFRLFVQDSQVTPFGAPCVGKNGREPLLGIANNLTNGKVSTVELHNAKPQTVALLALGFSNQSWGALPLPFDLGLIGAPGCKLLVGMDLVFPVVTAGQGDGNGVAQWPFPIPQDPGLANLHLYFQTLVLDSINSLGLITSGGLDAVIQ